MVHVCCVEGKLTTLCASAVFQRASAVQAQQALQVATVGTLALAGTPALVELCYDVTSGHVDTHVLMTLAVLGTIAMGAASEVSPPSCLQGAV